MKGMVFNLLEAFICEGWGDDKYEEILALCPLKTKEPFVGPGTYPDSDLMAIATKTAEILQLPAPQAIRAFGRYSFPKLAEKFPQFLEGHADPLSFILSVEGIIHVEIRKLFPSAITPSFVYRQVDESRLLIEYRSDRKLCAFMEGLIEGVSDYFNTPIEYAQVRCMHNADECCEFALTFEKDSRMVA